MYKVYLSGRYRPLKSREKDDHCNDDHVGMCGLYNMKETREADWHTLRPLNHST